MPSASVVEVLGSPSIVATDEQRRAVWVYDQISAERVYSADSGGIASLILGGAPSEYRRGSTGATATPRTFTVIVNFDETSRVRDYTYHTSRF